MTPLKAPTTQSPGAALGSRGFQVWAPRHRKNSCGRNSQGRSWVVTRHGGECGLGLFVKDTGEDWPVEQHRGVWQRLCRDAGVHLCHGWGSFEPPDPPQVSLTCLSVAADAAATTSAFQGRRMKGGTKAFPDTSPSSSLTAAFSAAGGLWKTTGLGEFPFHGSKTVQTRESETAQNPKLCLFKLMHFLILPQFWHKIFFFFSCW